MKLLRKIDSYFLYDEVDEESAPLGDYLFFYGMVASSLIGTAYFIYKIMTL